MTAFLYTIVSSTIPFVVMISLIVTIHELGHFLTAKAFGTAIDRFSMGFGKAIISWRDRAGVEWRVGWIPLGGYVKFAGDENAASMPDKTSLDEARASIVAREGPGAELKYLAFKPLWQRTLIILAGPAANFLLAIVIFAAFFLSFGAPVTTPRVQAVVQGEAGQQAGFHAGDLIVSADGRPMNTFEEVQFYVQYRPGVPIDFTVRRQGALIHLVARPKAIQEPSAFGGSQAVGRLGLEAAEGAIVHVGPVRAVSLAVQRTWDVAATTAYALGRIVTGHMRADQLHSIVGMVHASGTITKEAITAAHAAKVSWIVAEAFFMSQLAAVMSVSIGLLNLLPVPTLDGGHLIFYAYEWVAKRPAAAKVQAAGYRAGLALLLGLMLFATWNDVERLRLFRFIGSLFS
ncbi:MAG: RIP metalloprotease [Caulobacteraceae bacterium]|nr:RIP metalloprotease [Caulobacteraceae bacterium]